MDKTTRQKAGLRKTILNDVKQGGFFKTLKREWQAIRDFYIDEESSRKLADMGRVRRGLYFTYWLLKSLFLKLTPARRLLLLLVFFLFFQHQNTSSFSGNLLLSGFVLLFILMLELKDKLLAKQELEAGRAVQFALMPETAPVIEGWDIWLYSRPAREVGGDLVDYLPVSADRHALVLGDVAGKGLGAALFMARLQAVLRALAPDYSNPALLIEKINTIFYRDKTANSFASLLYLEIQSGREEVICVNAGHLPPLLIGNNVLKELDKGQPALGLMDDTKYIEQTIRFIAGDVLLIYSDGLSEAKNAENKFFEDARIKRMAQQLAGDSAQKIGEKIVETVEQFTEDTPLSDDLSLMVIKKR